MSPPTIPISHADAQIKAWVLPDECKDLIRQVTVEFEKALQRETTSGPVVDARQKSLNERGIRSVLDDLTLALSPWQGRSDLSEADKDAMASLITAHLLRIDAGHYLFDEPFLSFFIEQGYLEAARDFTDRVGQEDKDLSPEETFQALRNVWIMNSLQLMWDVPLAITPSVYAYSLLYPYTDNFLDDPFVTREEKSAFNGMVSRALKGDAVGSIHPSAARIQELIRMIRSQYPAEYFPQVIGSIELIQDAQSRSMRQDMAALLETSDLLSLSFYKGGTSVLADAYLVKGILSDEERDFAFFYGSFLQLVDDLQDARSDLKEGHQTLYSTKIREGALDGPIRQLMGLIGLVNEPRATDAPMMRYMKTVIGTCSHLMVLDVLGRDPSLVSPSFYDELQRPAKVHLSFFKEIADRLAALSSAFD